MTLRVLASGVWFLLSCSLSLGERDLPDIRKDDIVIFWNKVGLELNRVDHTGIGLPGDQLSCTQGPPNSAIQLASAHGAMFDAYNSIVQKYKPFQILVDDAEGGDVVAAISKAAHDVFWDKYDLQRPYIRARFREAMRKAKQGESRRIGLRVGTKAAAAMIQSRDGDGSCIYGSYEYSPASEIPAHQDDPNTTGEQVVIGPSQGHVKPYTVQNITDFLARKPPGVQSKAYTRAFNQVKDLGADGVTNPTTRTPLETVIGWYHSYNASPSVGAPCVLVNEVVLEVSSIEKLSTEENVVLFAQVNLAMGDGGIASWRDKYRFNYWRPIIGIRRADEDKNDETEPKKDWFPLGAARSNPFPDECNFTPPFPTYTSGHATFCAAGMKAVMNVLQKNDIRFNFVSTEFDGETFDHLGRVRPRLNQAFKKLSVFSSQCAASRIFNGVHWVFDGTEGVKAGYKIADHIYENVIVPRTGPKPRAFGGAPKVQREIQQILNGKIKPIFSLSDDKVSKVRKAAFDSIDLGLGEARSIVKEAARSKRPSLNKVVREYLDSPALPERASCIRP